MKRHLTVQDVADIVEAMQTADAEALEEALAKPDADRVDLYRYFELRQAALSILAGAKPEPGHPLGATEALAQVAMEIMGFSMRRTHNGRPPCPRCFLEASTNILRYFGRAAGLKPEQIVRDFPPVVSRH